MIYLSGLANEEVHIITIHHSFKEIIIRSKSKSINGHLLFLLDEALSLKFNYDKIFQIEEDANDFFFQNSSDIEKILLNKKNNLSMEILYWSEPLNKLSCTNF